MEKAIAAVQKYRKLLPVVKHSLQDSLGPSYDVEAAVLNFKKPSQATDGALTDDDVIIRDEGDAIVGMTIHAGKR